MVNKRLINTGAEAAPAAFDALANFETVTYTGNGSTQKITGYIRKGAAFNGSSSKIDLGSSALKQLPMTISLWLNPVTNANATFYSNLSSSTEGFYCRVQSDGSFLIDAYNGGSNRTLLNNTTGSIPDNTWSHVAITFDSSNVILYINGSETDRVSTNANGIGFTASEPTKLGVRGTSSDWYNGKIDQVRIFNTVLTPTQVGELALETYADPKKSTTDIFGDSSGVALYQLDEDANVSASYGSGAIDSGQSADFNGTNSKIVTGSSILSTGDVAISAWVKFDTISGVQPIICRDDVGSNRRLQLRNYDGTINAYWFHSGGLSALSSNKTVVASQWYHITSVFSENNYNRLYINGVLDAEDTSSIGTRSAIDFLNLGFLDTGDSLSGEIDDVRIYSSTLTSSEIGYIVSNDIVNIPTANLVAHYKLDGNANDETTNYNGTATNIGYTTPAEIPSHPYNGTPTNVNFLGMAFQPDLVWVKSRTSAYSHNLQDSVRGGGQSTALNPNLTLAEGTYGIYGFIDTFDTNGFTTGTGSTNNVHVNQSGVDYVAWCWKAGGAAVSNTDGSITSTVSANPDAGFSIVKYEGAGSGDQTVGHGLSSAPELVIIKNLTDSQNWIIWHKDFNSSEYLQFTTATKQTFTDIWGGTPSISEIYVGSDRFNSMSAVGDDYIAYCFHSVDGHQRISSYNGTSTTNRIYTTDDGTSTGNGGFRPRFLLIKKYTAADDWIIYDSTRGEDLKLRPNKDDVENSLRDDLDFEDDGFTLYGSYGLSNASGQSYIYLAIA